MRGWPVRVLGCVALTLTLVGCDEDRGAPAVTPAGEAQSVKTSALEGGAKLLQGAGPSDNFDVYLVGFHPMAEHPQHQMESHHYCRQVNEDFAQCVLFDSNAEDANLHGVEYIISERLYAELPDAERALWHPHNHEILSGQLIAPGLPEVAEFSLMKQKLNSYGKTWHTWDTGSTVSAGVSLPLGEPRLAWSFNADGEADVEMVRRRDEAMGVDSMARRASRQELVPLARPQHGVERLSDAFGARTRLPGVVDADTAPGVDETAMPPE